MGKVISVALQKGGTAKTSSTFNISAILASRGYRVLMIDNDEQASLTLSVAMDPSELPAAVTDVFYRRKPISECIYETGVENLWIVPANIGLAKVNLDIDRLGLSAKRNILKKALCDIKDDYDFILIDCAPSLYITVLNALVCSDYVLIPCKPSRLSTYALTDLMSTIESVKDVNPSLEVLGVLVTMFRKRIKVHEAELERLRSEYDICGVIMESADAERAVEEGLPAVLFKSGSKIAKQYEECTEYILKKMGAVANEEE